MLSRRLLVGGEELEVALSSASDGAVPPMRDGIKLE